MSLQTLRPLTFTVKTKDSGHYSQNFSVKKPFSHRIYFLLLIDNRFFFLLFLLAFKALKFSLTSQFLLASKSFWQLVAFILSRVLIGFPASSDESNVMRRRYLIKKLQQISVFFISIFESYFKKPPARDLQAFSCSPNNPRGFMRSIT